MIRYGIGLVTTGSATLRRRLETAVAVAMACPALSYAFRFELSGGTCIQDTWRTDVLPATSLPPDSAR